MRRNVDIPIWLIIIAILLLFVVLVWLWQVKGREAAAEQYERQAQAEAELYASNRRADLAVLQQLRPIVHGEIVVLPISVTDGCVNYDIRYAKSGSHVQTQQDQLDMPKDADDLAIAYQIVLASLDKPLKDNQLLPGNNFTSQNVWQRGIKALHDRRWIRADNTGTYPAIGHDLAWLKRMIETESSVTALPRASDQQSRIKLAGNGNGNTERE